MEDEGAGGHARAFFLARTMRNPEAETPEERLARKREHGRRYRERRRQQGIKRPETPEQREKRLAYLREYNKQYVTSMTPEQHEAFLSAKRETQRKLYERMTPEQREKHNQRNREWRAKRVMTPEQRERKNQRDRESRKGRVMTPEQRAEHNRRNREWRARKKQREGGGNENSPAGAKGAEQHRAAWLELGDMSC